MCADTLPSDNVSVYPIGIGYALRLAVSKSVRDAVIRSRTFNNVVSKKLGILPKEQAISLDDYFAKSCKKGK